MLSSFGRGVVRSQGEVEFKDPAGNLQNQVSAAHTHTFEEVLFIQRKECNEELFS